MQEQSKGTQNNEQKDEALEALDKVLHSESEEEFLENSMIIGKALNDEYQRREKATKVKAPNVKGLTAAKAFEDFVKEHFEDAAHIEKFYSKLSDDVTYSVFLPRVLVDNVLADGVMQQFAAILSEATGFEVIIETENPKYAGLLCLDITFPVIIRA